MPAGWIRWPGWLPVPHVESFRKLLAAISRGTTLNEDMKRKLALASLTVFSAATADPTFYRDVLPILQKNCQGCHRPGEIGPMPLESYQQVRPWAKAIREAVLTKKMPPWFADPHAGKFANDRSLAAPTRPGGVE